MIARVPFVSLVVGIRFEWQRIKTYNDCQVGDRVWLMQDGNNKHHSNAIEVWTGRGKPQVVGYLPREKADWVMRHWNDWLTADGVILLRGEDYVKRLDNRYCLNVVITQFNERG